MNEPRTIAVCIPTRNQAELIGDALASAFAQTVTPSDVVISDDAGTDNTAEVVERFRSKLSPELGQRLRYDRSPVTLGIGGNFDRAVRLAAGDFVVKLDSDDMLEKDFVHVMSRQLEAHPQAGWAHCNVVNIHSDGKAIGLAHTRKKTGFYAATDALPAYLKRNDTCHCVLLRKSAYLAVGGYRPEMKTCEDWLLWLEMLFSGWGYCFDARPLARMRKYEARPELMSKRRTDFVSSIWFMRDKLQVLLQGEQRLDRVVAVGTFQKASANLCISSGCDESNQAVRAMLFDAAYELDPSSRNRLWKTLGCPLPPETTRLAVRLMNLPRDSARTIVQKLLS